MNKSHISSLQKKDCCGCGACGYICPVHAISFQADEEGFLFPLVDEDKCIHCGKCLHVCAWQGKAHLPLYSVKAQFAARLKDPLLRMKSRSGGVFVALTDIILARGGIVFGAVMDSSFRVYHTAASSASARDAMRGSKYVQSDSTSIWPLVEKSLLSGQPVLFSGTPCQVAAAASLFPSKQYPQLYLCDFLCHGVPSPGLWKEYLCWAQKHYKQNLCCVEFRDKEKYPWSAHVEKLIFLHKTIYSRRYTNLFYANQILRESCYCCPYTNPQRCSDFTLADYWGIEKVAPKLNDEKGISLVLLRTDRAKVLFQECSNLLEYVDTSSNPPEHYSLKRPTQCPADREHFWQDYKRYGFEYVSKKYGRYDLLHRLKYKLIDHWE